MTYQYPSGSDAIRDSVATVISRGVQIMEPQLNEIAVKIANEAYLRGRTLANSTYNSIRRQPFYLVGFAALLLIGAAAMIGVQKRRALQAEVQSES